MNYEFDRLLSINELQMNSIYFQMIQVQCEGIRFEPQFPRLLQTKHETSPTRNGSLQRMDSQNPVHAIGRSARRRFGRFLPIRQHAKLRYINPTKTTNQQTIHYFCLTSIQFFILFFFPFFLMIRFA